MAQEVFKRVEIKYILNEEQHKALMELMKAYMKIDKYGLSTITSIYYDTDCYDIIRESMEKPAYKEKLRLRAYGDITDESTVFLELKKKYKGIVYKRRIEIPISEAEEYLKQGKYPSKDSQILREIDYFIKLYKPYNPTMIACERVAMYGIENKDIRITIDSNLRTKFKPTNLRDSEGMIKLLGENEYLMEVKLPDSMPLWLSKALSEYRVYPTSFSKIGTACRDNLIFETDKTNRKVTVSTNYDKEKKLC